MWLAPVLSAISNVAARVFYRLTITGNEVPQRGPVLLVANHPNSLLDPVLVAAAAGRRVRFLAKAPLFSDAKVGFMVRGSGAIPVYRQVDDPTAMAGNRDMFRSVFSALSDGDAVGLFPEGISHTSPSLAPLKTGAARIALGALEQCGFFPIIPIGLVLREKGVFRSEAMAVVGNPVDWKDLSDRGPGDRDAVNELTARIDGALRKVTINLEDWADQPLLDCAADLWAAEFDDNLKPETTVERLETANHILKTVRSHNREDWNEIVLDVGHHARHLAQLGLKPSDLSADTRLRTALRWAAGRVYLIGLPGLLVAALGHTLFMVPYHVTGRVADRAGADPDQLSTWKLLVGIPVYVLWVLLLIATLIVLLGALKGLLAGLAVPLVGFIGLWLRERWRDSLSDARRFFLLRSRTALIQSLRQSQSQIAARLKELVESTPD